MRVMGYARDGLCACYEATAPERRPARLRQTEYAVP